MKVNINVGCLTYEELLNLILETQHELNKRGTLTECHILNAKKHEKSVFLNKNKMKK